ncbi:MAG: F0F1 ATP synthase subunit epsilon [Phycisphaerae bacterium]|nr:F0F1 ATP synthase subunit epsilon [Phycisphaerae bacterium]MCZ2401108.1 F0F1 ATP synthase subunit epsilon [Phycisphaerae bacterium]NUQ49144.1 F0F1 ATP synthase subunit epsilon [Phycisphaerae bacterium]
MAKDHLELLVITPERQALAEPADSVVIPAHDGELGVLVRRAPLMCELDIGLLRYRRGNVTRRVFIDGGFAQVFQNTVTVLTERAVTQDEAPDAVAPGAQPPTEAEGRRKAARRQSALRRLARERKD